MSLKCVLAKNVCKCKVDENFIMLNNGGQLYFNQMREFIFLPMKVQINKSSVTEVANIAGVHINMDTST